MLSDEPSLSSSSLTPSPLYVLCMYGSFFFLRQQKHVISAINRNMTTDPAMITFIMLFSRKALTELFVLSPPLGTVPDDVPPGFVLLDGSFD